MTVVDRKAVVRRHTVEMAEIDPTSPLSVGNGELCLTVDVTGLQTFPEQYPVTDPGGGTPGTLLGTQSQWGWHSVPRPAGVDLADTRRPYRSAGREVPYVDSDPQSGSDDSGLDEARRWLRANPHRLDLARIGLVIREASGSLRAPSLADLGASRQVLDLWTGVIRSDVVLAGHRLHVTTAIHPDRDGVAIRVDCRRHVQAVPGEHDVAANDAGPQVQHLPTGPEVCQRGGTEGTGSLTDHQADTGQVQAVRVGPQPAASLVQPRVVRPGLRVGVDVRDLAARRTVGTARVREIDAGRSRDTVPAPLRLGTEQRPRRTTAWVGHRILLGEGLQAGDVHGQAQLPVADGHR